MVFQGRLLTTEGVRGGRGGGADLASHAHGGGAVVLLLQELADSPKVGQLEPAGLQAAGTRDAVTLAGHICQVVNRLEEVKWKQTQ